MKNDEKTTLKEYRSESGVSSNGSSNDGIRNGCPWDNNWLSSVTNG